MKFHIFDLDHTVIDPSHRQRLLPNGDLDLAHWIENRANAKLVMKDKILPFAEYWRTVKAAGQPIAICTSRVISALEYRYLDQARLEHDYFLSELTLSPAGGSARPSYSRVETHSSTDGTGARSWGGW